ncbi:DMT family transporter [Salipiger sp. 1_MG-2023]|nr:DMT family transporter [Salipiger sp. 1_MG-2023]
MKQDNPLLGMTLMLGFCILAPLADAIAKLLGDSVPIAELVFFRFAVQVILLVPLMLLTGRNFYMSRDVFLLAGLRTLMHIGGIAMMVTAVRYLPLADAVAIAFVMPFLMLILGKALLNEEVGPVRLAACAVGFVGTMMVVQPAFQTFGWPALLPLGVAVNFSLFMVATRRMARDIDAISLQATSGLMAVVLVGPMLLLMPAGIAPELSWVGFPEGTFGLLIGIGFVGTVAHLLMTWSLRFAPGATLAPMQYLELPFATALGFALFGELPNQLASTGILVIMAAGLFIFLRERASHRARLAAPAQVPGAIQAAE